MTAFMIIVVIALFIVLVGFTLYRLEALDGIERIILCVAGILISWGITSILFSISTKGVSYTNIEIQNELSKVLILVFTPINGILIMPYTAKIINQVKFEEITIAEAIKKIAILLIILLIIFFIETKYLTKIQTGVLDIVEGLKK